MLGYKTEAQRAKPKNKGGRITGPGTGTSDSIKKNVENGSYIMPADSTEAIGEQALAEMGNDVPVNVSNGEYEMPPEQVHAVGVQALDQMKNATHEPVQKPQQGLGYDPELFFANGGLVNPLKGVGEYWSESNANFESTNPSLIRRVGRAINPLTGFGSAVGAMHDGASSGSFKDMGIAAFQAVPVFGAMRAAAPTLKAAGGYVPSVAKTLSTGAGSAAAGVSFDEAQARGFADGGPVYKEERKKPNVFNQFAPQTPTPTPMATQQKPAGVIDQAMADTQRRMNDPILKNATQAPEPEQATLASVANAGPGTANVGPFKVSHLPSYNQGGQDSNARGMRALMGDAYPDWDANGQATGIFKRGRQEASMAAQNVAESVGRGDYAHAAGIVLRGGLAPNLGYVSDVKHGAVIPVSNAIKSGVTDVSNAIKSGAADLYSGATGGESESVKAAKAEAASPPAQEVAPAASPALEQPAADPAGAVPVGEQAAKPETYASGIQKPTMVDGVPTFTNEHVRGFDPATANTISSQAMMAPSASTQQALSGAMQAAAARGDFAAINQSLARQGQQPIGGMPMQGGGGTRFNVIRDTSRDDALRRKLISAATTPHRGAQNGQLTRGQIDAMRGLMSDERSDQTTRDTSAQSNQTTLQAEAMRQSGQQARNQIDERRLGLDERIAAPTLARAEQEQSLYQAYKDAETPEERSAIQQQLQFLQGGKEQTPRFAVAAGGQGFNADGTPYTLPAQIYNQHTGEILNPYGQQQQQSSDRPVGTKSTVNGKTAVWDGSKWVPQKG